jgi:uncharacterized membrane protein YbhN (UPF0104 family)
MTQHASRKFSKRLRVRTAVELLIVAVLCYVVIAGFTGLKRSWHEIASANMYILLVALGVFALSYIVAGCTYVFLAPGRLPLGSTILVQVAGGLVNRLFPGGLGGLGLNGLYIHRRGYSVTVATAMVATNNLFGFLGNAILLTVTIVAFSLPAAHFSLPKPSFWLLAGLGLLILLIALVAMRQKNLRKRVRTSLIEGWEYIRGVMQRPVKSGAALLSSCCLTSLHATALFLVVHAAHAHVTWPVALLAITVGAFTGAAIPTPGGIGGAEAGIAGLLAAFSLPASTAVATALLYRGLTYWIPLLPGYLALRIAEKRYL